MSSLRFIEPGEVETLVFDWGSIKWLSEPKVTQTQRFSAGVVILEPGKGHERHNHPGVEEILYVVSGTGEQMVEVMGDDGEMKEERREVVAGMLIHIPPDVLEETVQQTEYRKLIRLPHNINDPEFAEALVKHFLESVA